MRDTGVGGYLLAFGLAWLADAVAHRGQPAHAAILFGAAEAQLRRKGVKPNPTMQLSPRDGSAWRRLNLNMTNFTAPGMTDTRWIRRESLRTR